MRRLGAGINSDFAVDDGRSEAVNVVNRHAGVAPLAGLAAIRAGVNRAEECAGEHHTAGWLEDDRTDMVAAQRAPGFAPLAIVVSFKKHQSVLSCDPEFARAIGCRINIGSAVR